VRRGTLIAILILIVVLAAAALFQIFLFTEGERRFPEGPSPPPTASP
jgi:flagellar basal body-associated protein FliL